MHESDKKTWFPTITTNSCKRGFMMSYPILRTAAGREFVRTPEECFENLADFNYQPNYVLVDGLRVHYVDAGPQDGDLVLLLHGQPDWSYLYRKMIPLIVAAGHRVIAPDMIGMGRSDKPIDIHTHTIEQHAEWLHELITQLGLNQITLFCQDWGGFTGLPVVARYPGLFSRVLCSNSGLILMPEPVLDVPQGINREDFPVDADAKLRTFDDLLKYARDKCLIKEDMSEFFDAWLHFALTAPDFKPSQNIRADFGVIPLTDDEARAYDAPFPDEIFRTGVRTLPSMGALIDKEKNLDAWEALKTFDKPFLTVFGEYDMLVGTKKNQDALIENIPGAAGQAHDRIPAGHFIQESQGEEMAKRLIEFMAAN
jgi:haloalkane dehalogenase